MTSEGDAADDAAIWVHATDASMSMVIGTNKQVGLMVYDLNGKLLQTVADGRMNNVDVLQGVRTSSGKVDLVAASNRTNDSIAVYRVNHADRSLVRLVEGGIPAGLKEVYGICLWTDPKTGRAQVGINSKGGTVRVFDLQETAGKWSGNMVREFHVGTQVEGIVADVKHGWLYVGEEQVGVWRYPLDPTREEPRKLLDIVQSSGATVGGNLSPDVEGVTIYEQADGSGWIIVSCQGQDRYAMYDRITGAYVGSFGLQLSLPGGGTDRVTHTDGITALSTALGPKFPRGAFVVQDDNDGAAQNFKIVNWDDIKKVMNLSAVPVQR
ncbi:MAG: phytase [Phycisphaerales bacterium]|nr:phytase [Phycisphaerales bacterium]